MVDQLSDGNVEVIESEVEDAEAWTPLYKIVSYPADYTLEVLNEKWLRNELLIPDFQRGWVWNILQASRLVESFLMGLPVPNIFLFKEPSGSMLVIDGQQRLKTVISFIKGILPDERRFSLKLSNDKSDEQSRWEGATYDSLTESERRTFRDAILRAVIVEQLDPKDDSSMYHIFERLNTGGTSLTPQEIRNCVYHGPFNDFLGDLNKYPHWRSIFGNVSHDRHMRDTELILRFIALYDSGGNYTKPMKTFLNQYAKAHRSLEDTTVYSMRFYKVIDQVYSTLGYKPFHIKQGINAAAFDAVMVAFARAVDGDQPIPNDVAERYENLKLNARFLQAVSSATTDEASVRARREIAWDVLFS